MTTITPELLADLRRKAEKASPHFDLKTGEYTALGEVMLSCHQYVAASNPAVVLALLGRIAALESAKSTDATAAMLALSDAERAGILAKFHSCGSSDPGCQCENDE